MKPCKTTRQWFVAAALGASMFHWDATGFAADRLSPDMLTALRHACGPFLYNGKPWAEARDLSNLERLVQSSDKKCGEIAASRLRVERMHDFYLELSKTAGADIKVMIRKAPMTLARKIVETLRDEWDEDKSFEEIVGDGFIEGLNKLHNAAMRKAQAVGVASIAGITEEAHFRGLVAGALGGREPSETTMSSLSPTLVANVEKGDVSITLQNQTGAALNNCVIVVEIHSSKELYSKEDMINEAGLILMSKYFGIDPTQDAKLSFLMRLNMSLDRGSVIAVPRWEPSASLQFELDQARRFARCAKSADVTFYCDEFCFKEKAIPVQPTLTSIQEQMQQRANKLRQAALGGGQRPSANARQQTPSQPGISADSPPRAGVADSGPPRAGTPAGPPRAGTPAAPPRAASSATPPRATQPAMPPRANSPTATPRATSPGSVPRAKSPGSVPRAN